MVPQILPPDPFTERPEQMRGGTGTEHLSQRLHAVTLGQLCLTQGCVSLEQGAQHLPAGMRLRAGKPGYLEGV